MKRSMRHVFLLLAALCLATGSAWSPGTGLAAARPEADQAAAPSEALTQQLIVKFEPGAAPNGRGSPSAWLPALSAAAGQPLAYVRGMSGEAHVLRLPRAVPASQAAALAQRLAAHPGVAYAEPDAWVHPLLTPNDPRYSDQWHYFGTYGINLPAAWDITTGSSSVYVAVLDTGITDHADLAGRWVGGYDFISDNTTANDGGGRDSDPRDPGDWQDPGQCGNAQFVPSSWHGTHVAGTIGAASNNGVGVAGVNWVSQIVPVRVLGKCGGQMSDVIDSMRWAAGLAVVGVPANPHPARVLNLSLGGGGSCDQPLQDAVDDVLAVGAVVVVAAGNSNVNVSGSQPANCNGVITVAATTTGGDKASFSNYGAGVEISAPGSSVWSTADTGTTSPAGSTYKAYGGTSMAAPHVAGVASLMLSVNPALSPAEVAQIIQATARASNCSTSICGSGIVDAAAAVVAADANACGLPAQASVSGGAAVQGDYQLYLPMVSVNTPAGPGCITGRATHGGAAASGVALALYFHNGSGWSDSGLSATTRPDGYFAFPSAPSLQGGQRYSVCYSNTSNSSRLYMWCTRDISDYQAGQAADAGTFDLANVQQSSPASGASVALPHTFQWATRAGSPSDSYEFNVYDYDTEDPWFYTVPPLGFTGSYTLQSLPPGFVTGHEYTWEIWLHAPDGGAGISYWTRPVTFASSSLAEAAGALGEAAREGLGVERLLERR